jgi:hypothetical protein
VKWLRLVGGELGRFIRNALAEKFPKYLLHSDFPLLVSALRFTGPGPVEALWHQSDLSYGKIRGPAVNETETVRKIY